MQTHQEEQGLGIGSCQRGIASEQPLEPCYGYWTFMSNGNAGLEVLSHSLMGNQVCVLAWKACTIAPASAELVARRSLQTSCHSMLDGTAILAPRLCMESRKTDARATLSSLGFREGVGGSTADKASVSCPLVLERACGVVFD